MYTYRFVVSERFHYPARIVERSKCGWVINPTHLSHPHAPPGELNLYDTWVSSSHWTLHLRRRLRGPQPGAVGAKSLGFTNRTPKTSQYSLAIHISTPVLKTFLCATKSLGFTNRTPKTSQYSLAIHISTPELKTFLCVTKSLGFTNRTPKTSQYSLAIHISTPELKIFLCVTK